MAIAIQLSRNRQIIVDDDFDEELLRFSWNINNRGYVHAKIVKDRKECWISMHRFLANATEGQLVDHRNGNKLDNRLCNLRLCTFAQNSYNKSISSKNITGYKGVILRYGKYKAQIKVDGKHIQLGSFDDITQAAYAYDDAARKYFGEFANTNFNNYIVPEPIVNKVVNLKLDDNVRKDSTSGYRGVVKFYGRWRARIQNNKNRISLGLFDNPHDAYKAILAYKGEM